MTQIAVFGQDAEFSQFYAAPLYLNPAIAGITVGPRVNINYRNEWPAIDKGFVTYAVSYDQHFQAISGGVGLSLMADRVAGGLLNTYSVGGIYSYQLKLARNFGIKIGAEASYVYQNINWNSLKFYDQIDPVYGFVNEFSQPNPTQELPLDKQKMSFVDFSAGFIAYSPSIYGGVAVKHLSQPKISYTGFDDNARLPIRVAIHAGANIKTSERPRKNNFISPNVLLVQQSNFTQLNVGAYVNVEPIFGGVWYRHTFSNVDAVIAQIGLTIDFFRLGYSYDYTLSQLGGSSGGAHEISMALNFGGDGNSLNAKKGVLECPPMLNF